jgi:hypothetical protein
LSGNGLLLVVGVLLLDVVLGLFPALAAERVANAVAELDIY